MGTSQHRVTSRISPQPRKQVTSQELRDELLRFIQDKFYPGDAVSFSKDQPRLLKWVVLKFAKYLDTRGVTVTTERYIEVVRDKILMEALRHGNTDAIAYRPAWLGRVIDSHLRIHGDDYYFAAKSLRDASLGALKIAQGAIGQAHDPIRELAAADRLLRPKKVAKKPPVKDQLTLL